MNPHFCSDIECLGFHISFPKEKFVHIDYMHFLSDCLWLTISGLESVEWEKIVPTLAEILLFIVCHIYTSLGVLRLLQTAQCTAGNQVDISNVWCSWSVQGLIHKYPIYSSKFPKVRQTHWSPEYVLNTWGESF